MKIVMKFGGTSVADGRRIRHVASLAARFSPGNQLVVVCSAMGDVTDELISLTEDARAGSEKAVEARLAAIRENHLAALKEAVKSPEVAAKVRRKLMETLAQLGQLARGSTILRELTPRSRDGILSSGERLSNPIVWGALLDQGVDSVYLTGGECGIMTDDNFGDAAPLMEVTGYQVKENLGRIMGEGKTPVVTGYIGATQGGEMTTFGPRRLRPHGHGDRVLDSGRRGLDLERRRRSDDGGPQDRPGGQGPQRGLLCGGRRDGGLRGQGAAPTYPGARRREGDTRPVPEHVQARPSRDCRPPRPQGLRQEHSEVCRSGQGRRDNHADGREHGRTTGERGQDLRRCREERDQHPDDLAVRLRVEHKHGRQPFDDAEGRQRAGADDARPGRPETGKLRGRRERRSRWSGEG